MQKDRITIHMATDYEKLSEQSDPVAPWRNFVADKDSPRDNM